MVKPLVTYKNDLKQISVNATKDDLYICNDLSDTFNVTPNCAGMAANMIGYQKRICIIMLDDYKSLILINPVILSKKDSYEAYENCACFPSEPAIKTTRYKTIKVEYYNEKMQKRIKNFSDLTAEIIQHQIDHFEGIVI